MFGILVYDILFFTIPAGLLAFLGVSIYRYASARKKNAKDPETFSPSAMKIRKILLIIAAVLAGIFLLIVIGLMTLVYMVVAYM